ncbi:MAG TPA: hypothetical protein VF756_21405 [Thermoanaerobaculia bacterium]
MSIKEIEEAITRLSAKDVAELMAWLEEYHAQLWDQQIEEDLETGRLDALLAEVDEEYEKGPQAGRQDKETVVRARRGAQPGAW